ncbi:hypothetical protein MesoLj113a_39190 [Mesorhizobium sp. 113-1-2]|nr:Cytochrome c oxidase subunit 2 [Mesorhizobium loti]BCG72761.1 hypothetical protein MesoLj113a_39190 [Mesorhizobium sp. 113-1-2]
MASSAMPRTMSMATMRLDGSGTGAVGVWMVMVSRSDSAPPEDYHGWAGQKKAEASDQAAL